MILALLNLFTLIAYFSACLASKEPSMKRLWCWRVPRVLVIGALIDINLYRMFVIGGLSPLTVSSRDST